MSTRRAPALAAVLGAALLAAGAVGLAGCTAEPTGLGGPSPSPSGSATPGGSVTPSDSQFPPQPSPPQPSRVPAPTTGPTKPVPTGPTSLTGTVEMAGIEGGCLVLRTGDATYELMGGDRTVLRHGARVTVTGKVNPNVATICQMGPVFEVSTARPA